MVIEEINYLRVFMRGRNKGDYFYFGFKVILILGLIFLISAPEYL